jgi:VWFA-related protein
VCRISAVALGLLVALPLIAANRISVTVIDNKTGKPVSDLKAEDFLVYEDKLVRKVEACEFLTEPVDVMFLLDTSLVGPRVRPVADDLISQLQPKEQMAIVAYHSSADLIQDFTNSRQQLAHAIESISYGNTPRLLDGLYAAIDTGMKNAVLRRVAIVLTTGYEGDSRMDYRAVIRLARKSGVTIYPVYAEGRERGLFEDLARGTGGAVFSLPQLAKSSREKVGERIFDAIRGHYVLSVPGNLALGEKLKVEINRPGKWFASALPLEWE